MSIPTPQDRATWRDEQDLIATHFMLHGGRRTAEMWTGRAMVALNALEAAETERDEALTILAVSDREKEWVRECARRAESKLRRAAAILREAGIHEADCPAEDGDPCSCLASFGLHVQADQEES